MLNLQGDHQHIYNKVWPNLATATLDEDEKSLHIVQYFQWKDLFVQ